MKQMTEVQERVQGQKEEVARSARGSAHTQTALLYDNEY